MSRGFDQVVNRKRGTTRYTKQRPDYIMRKIAHMQRMGIITAGLTKKGAASPDP